MSLHETELEKLLECVNLLCNSARGNRQFFGSGSDAATAAHDLKGMNGPQGRRSGHAWGLCERKLWDVRMDLV